MPPTRREAMTQRRFNAEEKGNPRRNGAGGWIQLQNDNEDEIQEGQGRRTNNLAELTAPTTIISLTRENELAESFCDFVLIIGWLSDTLQVSSE